MTTPSSTSRTPATTRSLEDTESVATMMRSFEQTVRTVPTTDIDPDERLLRVRIVLEEALEFAEAMGCVVTTDGHDVAKGTVSVTVAPDTEIDLVEALDALGDLIVVTKGSAHTLGVPVDEAFRIIHGTNMAKMGPDGRPIRRADGKTLKPEGWQPPTEPLRALLVAHGWTGTEQPRDARTPRQPPAPWPQPAHPLT